MMSVKVVKCWRAFKNGEKEEAIRLLAFVNNPRRLKDNDHTTILHWACYHGWIDIVMKLINEYQFHLKYRDCYNNTPLHYACSQNRNLHIKRYLINECRCDPMIKNRSDNTPLHNACRYGDIEMVQYLIGECQCDLMCKNNVGNTLLHEACIGFPNIPVVEYILLLAKLIH